MLQRREWPPTRPSRGPELAVVVDALPDLPEALKTGILAMVKAARMS